MKILISQKSADKPAYKNINISLKKGRSGPEGDMSEIIINDE